MNVFPDHQLRPLVRRLLAWYRRHHRPLPWRAAPGSRPNPYHVLISEFMLQQTQVHTVIPYFHRFLARFPTLADLAQASLDEVLSLWQGLGYYHRARHLHAAAQTILSHHAGSIPSDPTTLQSLPGIGPYTAAAVASIAFDYPAAVLDANVARLLARLLALRQPLDRSPSRAHLHRQAQRLIHQTSYPGDLNQALMELGARLCSPRHPACPQCPLTPFCLAYKQNLTSSLPLRSPSRPLPQLFHHVLAIQYRRRFRFEQRPSTGLWPNLWQLTTCQATSPLAPADLVRWTRLHLHLSIQPPIPAAQFTHTLSHRKLQVTLWKTRLTHPPTHSSPSVQWRTLHRLADLPLSALQRRAVNLLLHSNP